MNIGRTNYPRTVWDSFAQAHGPEVIARAYRVGLPVRGEHVWAGWEDGKVVVWGSLVEDPFSQNYMYRAGVFPGFERKGYRDKIRRFLVDQAFQSKGCQAVTYGSMMGNTAQMARLHGEAVAGTWGEFAGVTWLPAPGMVHFVITRDRYESVILKQEERG